MHAVVVMVHGHVDCVVALAAAPQMTHFESQLLTPCQRTLVGRTAWALSKQYTAQS